MRLSGTKTGAINQYRGLGNQLWDLAGNRPSLDLPFADNKSLVDATTGANLVDFTRASSGTYVDSEGVIRTATTNLILWSENLQAGQWGVTGSGATITATTDFPAPNGTMTAWTLTSSGAFAQIQQAPAGISGATYTGSFWIRRRSGTGTVNIRVSENTNIPLVGVTSEWQRFSFAATSTSTTIRLGVNLSGTADAVDIWGAQLEQSTTVGEYIPTTSTINSAPRFDHDPTTGESLGLLVEESRTNSIRNNTMVGAVAGTPGTVPVNWTAGGNAALSREIVGTGIENGISYIDIRFFGTVASVAVPEMAIIFDSNQTAVAAASQAWTASSYLKVVGGSLSNVISGEIFVLGFNSSFVLTEASSTAFNYSTLTGALQTGRVSHTRTLLTGTTVRVNSRVDINFTGGGGVDADITLRIGLPQLEQGAFATSVIPTSGTAATRAADVASISGSNFSSWYRQDEGTIFCEGAVPVGVDSSRALVSIDNDSNAERIQLRHNSTTARIQLVVDNNSTQFSASLAPNSFPPGEYRKLAMAMKVNDFAGVVDDAGTVSQNSSGTMPTPTQMQIGLGPSNAQPCKPIKRLTYWPARLPNETLQTLTQ
jgi:hypothetical protein